MNRPDSIVIHTLAYKGDADVDKVRGWHVDGNGWSDIGYHYLIRRSGEIQKGREEHVQGAHALGYNTRSVGIALEGHGDHERWTIPQTRSLLRLCKQLMDRYPAIGVQTVIGHRETGAPKTCPGNLIDMASFRGLLMDYLPGEDQ